MTIVFTEQMLSLLFLYYIQCWRAGAGSRYFLQKDGARAGNKKYKEPEPKPYLVGAGKNPLKTASRRLY